MVPNCSLCQETTNIILSMVLHRHDTLRQAYSTNFRRRPDMFHNLHCINAVRMELNQNLYNHSSEATLHHHSFPESVVGPNYETAHLEHCLDRLRQAVMCHGDLTPSPLYVFKGFPVALGKSGKHTCRRFEPIRQWMDKRASTLGVIEGL
jgi:hypothetical protein